MEGVPRYRIMTYTFQDHSGWWSGVLPPNPAIKNTPAQKTTQSSNRHQQVPVTPDPSESMFNHDRKFHLAQENDLHHSPKTRSVVVWVPPQIQPISTTAQKKPQSAPTGTNMVPVTPDPSERLFNHGGGSSRQNDLLTTSTTIPGW
jgi:hypothetical protein